MAHQSVASAKSDQAKVAGQITQVQTQLAALQPILDRQEQITALEANLRSLLTTDVAWQTTMNHITPDPRAAETYRLFKGEVPPPVPVAVVTPPAASTE